MDRLDLPRSQDMHVYGSLLVVHLLVVHRWGSKNLESRNSQCEVDCSDCSEYLNDKEL